MKTRFFLSLLIALQVIVGCKKDDNGPTKIDKSEAISLGASYTNDIYYSLKNGLVAEVPRSNWDIAFSVSTRSSSIIINEGANVVLKEFAGTWNWDTAIDTAGYKTWTTLLNSNTTWEEGAFNDNATGHPNYGWGEYDMGSHNIVGSAKYIIKLRDGSFKKIFIELKKSAEQKYTFRFANLDGTNPVIISDLNVSTSKANYVYYNLVDNTVVTDREPDATTWDLVFTKWMDEVTGQPYPVTGVLQNIGVKAIDITSVDLNNVTFTEDQFVEDINTVGYDWKSFNMGTNAWTVAEDKVFIIKDINSKNFKVKFTGFGGSANGNLTFDIKEL